MMHDHAVCWNEWIRHGTIIGHYECTWSGFIRDYSVPNDDDLEAVIYSILFVHAILS